jgi:DNA polymerase-3 subunit gamma/tau
MDDESPGLGLDLPEQPERPADEAHYRVLARKYRPQTFAELIGQDAMVKTLGNAIERGRIAHAFLLTGVRGVGKTSTARLVAKALNCIGPDGQGGPTIDPCGVCEPCRAIAEGRHIDVIEMDAASHTGVDDVREIIEAVRYASVSARYKIYIIDEVHMLSKSAFNALLKTLEEPPAHVKFLFATTEVGKVRLPSCRAASGSTCAAFPPKRWPSISPGSRRRRMSRSSRRRCKPLPARRGLGPRRPVDPRPGDCPLAKAGSRPTRFATCWGRPTAAESAACSRRLLGGDLAATLEQLDEAHALGIEPGSLLRGLMESHACRDPRQGGGQERPAAVGRGART